MINDISNERRSFLISSAALGAGLAVGGLGFTPKAEASYTSFLEHPGPGVTNCRYKEFAGLYQFGGTTRFTRELLTGLLEVRHNNTVILKMKEYKLPPEVRFIEPLYYFAGRTLAEYHSAYFWKEDLEKQNLSMRYFDCCMNAFTDRWIKDYKGNYKRREEEFALKSICVAAFGKDKGEQAAKGMLDSDVNGKKIYAKKIIESFSRMKRYDKNSKDPQNPFNQALVANWAAYVITNHFENLVVTGTKTFSPGQK